jgi:hypothetical protein
MSIKVTLRGTSARHIDVYWETPYSVDTTYRVFRGGSFSGPFDPITTDLVDVYHIRDSLAPRKMAWRLLYYVVEAKHSNGDVERSEPTVLSARPPLDALEMIRLNGLLFKEYTGRPCLVYGRRTFGKKCTECIDAVTSVQLTNNCTSCYGVGYARGYHNPMYAYINLGPDVKAITPSEQLISQQHTIQGRMSVYPLVKPGDLVVEEEGTKWRVQNVSHTERLRAPVQQILNLFRIPEGDIEHQIPVQWNYDLETSPRSFNTRSDI